MPHFNEEEAAVEQFLAAFNFSDKVDVETVRKGLFSQRQLSDVNASRDYVDQFIKKCERRDPTGVKPLKKRVDAVMNESEQMTLMMDFLVRCRQAHLFHNPGGSATPSIGSSSNTTTPSVQSSPFQRRSASRTRVLSTLTGEPSLTNESTRSRANSSFTSYDNRMIGVERQRPKSPYRMATNSVIPSTRVTPLTASNHLFATNQTFTTPTNHPTGYLRNRDDSPSAYLQHRATPTHTMFTPQPPTDASIRSQQSSVKTTTPLHARIGSAITHPESHVCECLLSALLGMETRLFRPIHRKMSITSTASLSTSHAAVAQRVLCVANLYLLLSYREPNQPAEGSVSSALLASIRFVLGDYTVDIDGLRRQKNLKMHQILPLIDKWHVHLELLAKAHRLRNIDQLELLEALYMLHCSYSFDDDRRRVLDKILEYTMGVFCNQMMDWMTNGETPPEKWMIRKDATQGIALRKVPVFMSDVDARILLEIGKSLPRIESASDEDLAAVDKATTVVRSALNCQVIFRRELTPLLRILRDVVCGIVMRQVLTTGRLKEHVRKATSFFLLDDPRFTITLFNIIKDASYGMPVGKVSLSRQQVSGALASALEATTASGQSENEQKRDKLKFKLDVLTSLDGTPTVSPKMDFVRPLRPKYEPTMEIMKPIFAACDNEYESIFHVIWAIDLALLSSHEASAHLPAMKRFVQKVYCLRENTWCLINMLSHTFLLLNASLSRVRSLISMQAAHHLSRFVAAIDEKCDDVDDVIAEHRKFVLRLCVVVFVRNNDRIETELSNLLLLAFDVQKVVEEVWRVWNEVIETTKDDENVRKARVAEMCQKRIVEVRLLYDKANKTQKNLTELLDHQIAFGNEALLE
ncbi:unnamed protein product [Caenorhabditis sp. 36 PRJEB53466]|nr:unnamed protein product [Caenorhabditis sp. 36 PRJEB53466]